MGLVNSSPLLGIIMKHLDKENYLIAEQILKGDEANVSYNDELERHVDSVENYMREGEDNEWTDFIKNGNKQRAN